MSANKQAAVLSPFVEELVKAQKPHIITKKATKTDARGNKTTVDTTVVAFDKVTGANANPKSQLIRKHAAKTILAKAGQAAPSFVPKDAKALYVHENRGDKPVKELEAEFEELGSAAKKGFEKRAAQLQKDNESYQELVNDLATKLGDKVSTIHLFGDDKVDTVEGENMAQRTARVSKQWNEAKNDPKILKKFEKMKERILAERREWLQSRYGIDDKKRQEILLTAQVELGTENLRSELTKSFVAAGLGKALLKLEDPKLERNLDKQKKAAESLESDIKQQKDANAQLAKEAKAKAKEVAKEIKLTRENAKSERDEAVKRVRIEVQTKFQQQFQAMELKMVDKDSTIHRLKNLLKVNNIPLPSTGRAKSKSSDTKAKAKAAKEASKDKEATKDKEASKDKPKKSKSKSKKSTKEA